jgi:hypothetical protein
MSSCLPGGRFSLFVFLEAVYGRRNCHELPRPWQTRIPRIMLQIITSRFALLMMTVREESFALLMIAGRGDGSCALLQDDKGEFEPRAIVMRLCIRKIPAKRYKELNCKEPGWCVIITE